MKKLWGRKVSDLGLYQLLKRIEFKSKEHGKIANKINRFYPSTKLCSTCGCIKQHISLKERVYQCEYCNETIDRDLNAAINILTVGASTVGLDGVRRGQVPASIA